MIFRKTQLHEWQNLYDFYNRIIDHQKEDLFSARWTKDVYPSLADLKKHLQEDLFFCLEDKKRIIAAAAVSLHEDPIYRGAAWSGFFKDDEIAVIHLFGVDPSFRRKGIGLDFLERILRTLRASCKAVHLDALKDNGSAIGLYKKAGFSSIGDRTVFYEDTGYITVELFEFIVPDQASSLTMTSGADTPSR